MTHDVFHVFDTTLRDGTQREGINLTVADKLAIARHLDDFGVGFIEGGRPGANPRDTEFFSRAQQEIDFKNAQLVAFGATRRPGARAADDPQVKALLDSGAPVVTVVAKSHDRHVQLALRTTLDENLDMVRDTVSYLHEQGRRVFVDCAHFFDGYQANPQYAEAVVGAGAEAGAEVVILCDTNGGMLPAQIQAIVSAVLADTSARLGIHAQDDTGCAVANTLAAVDVGVTHVQCTANGYGERVGNANLFPVVAALELKYGMKLVPEGSLREMTRVSHAIAEIVNLPHSTHQPYVGASAFAHKAGLHASAMKADPDLYQHIAPVSTDRELLWRLVERIKEREEAEGRKDTYFELDSYGLLGSSRGEPAPAPESTACTLNVTLRDSRGALGRIAAVLSSMPVTALSYVVSDAAQATAEIQVSRADAPRARDRLNRMVDVLTVDESPPMPL